MYDDGQMDKVAKPLGCSVLNVKIEQYYGILRRIGERFLTITS